ncbi:COL12A [Mytilus coruscus]|uniref:COL12A n=1 Tax=Mytilus coruscus TaxID=42192 RepID=A0A6J8CC02_MYTCO|nr:COL12A [Mytilus coruscus]
MTKLSTSLLILLVVVTITESGRKAKFTGKRDVVFSLDSSASVGTANFEIMKNFARFINPSLHTWEDSDTIRPRYHARINSFSKSYGARTGVPKIAIVMTDGKSQDKDKTCESAKDLRNSGVKIMVIPIGNKVDKEEIKCLASEPSFISPVSNFAGLRNRRFRNRVAKKVFNVKGPVAIGAPGSSG